MSILIWLKTRGFKITHIQWSFRGYWISVRCGKIGTDMRGGRE